MRFAPALRRGYAKRYLRHQLGQHGVELLLAAAFLLGVLLGCQMTSEENTRLVEQLNGLLSAQQGSFLMQVVFLSRHLTILRQPLLLLRTHIHRL